jgi:hypothetical protein
MALPRPKVARYSVGLPAQLDDRGKDPFTRSSRHRPRTVVDHVRDERRRHAGLAGYVVAVPVTSQGNLAVLTWPFGRSREQRRITEGHSAAIQRGQIDITG